MPHANNMRIILTLLIILLSLSGFLIASYIHNKKRTKKRLICPMKSSCDKVIHSDYSKIMGIHVELLGMVYYFLIACSYAVLLSFQIQLFYLDQLLTLFSFFAVLFSCYLFIIQLAVIKKWCTWCLISATISLLIFILSYLHIFLK